MYFTELQACGDELKSRPQVIYAKTLNTHIPFNIECFYDYWLSRSWSQQCGTGKWQNRLNVPNKSFWDYHNDFSTIPIAFIVKFWFTSIGMISSGTLWMEIVSTSWIGSHFNKCTLLIEPQGIKLSMCICFQNKMRTSNSSYGCLKSRYYSHSLCERKCWLES